MTRKATVDTPARAVPASAPGRVRGQRRNPVALGLAVALAVVSGLAVAGLVVAGRGGHLYLAVARPVAYGAQIHAEDLATVRVATDAALAPVPASQKASIVGRYATMPLAAGTLLGASQVSAQAVPGPGRQVVSVALKADQAPARPLTPGATVLLVRTPDPSGLSGGGQAVAPTPVAGTVAASRQLDASGGVVVDVVVAEGDGPAIATSAAAGHVAIVVTAGG